MYAVGRLGSYITRGVYTVSAPFHPFGGAVDIIVVEQQDGSFKSSPWYVRFGKFQGVLKSKEKVVNINVNGVQADFHMYLDHKGEAYFLREVDGEEGDSVFYPSSSGEETDGQSSDRRSMKSRSCNYDADQTNLVTQIDVSHGEIVTRTSSRRSRILGLVFGRKSMKENSSQEEENSPGVVRATSLERAQIAADLLEVKWSTNLASSRSRKDNVLQFSAPGIFGGEADKDLPISDGRGEMDSPLPNNMVNNLDHPILHEEFGIHDNVMGTSSRLDFQKLGSFDEDFGVEMSSVNNEHIIGISNLGGSDLQENYGLNSQTIRAIDELGVTNADHDENGKIFIPETDSTDPHSVELDACPSKKLKEEQDFKEMDILLPGNGVSEEKSGADGVEAIVYSDTLEGSRVVSDGSVGKTDEILYVSCGGGAEVCVQAKTLNETAELISEVKAIEETSLLVEKEPLDFPKFLSDGNCGNFFNDTQILSSEGNSSNSFANSIVTETYTEMVTVDPLNGSVREVESCSICTISGFNNSNYEVQDRENKRHEDNTSKLQYSSNPLGDSQEFRGDIASTEAIIVSPSEGSEEEQLLFGDLDDLNHREVKCMESTSSIQVEKESHPSVTPKGSEAVTLSLNPNDESYSSSDKFVQENMPNDVDNFRQKSRIVSSCINIHINEKVAGEAIGRMAGSLPNMWSPIDDMVVDYSHHSLGHSLDSSSKSLKCIPLREDVSSCIKSDADKEDQVSQEQPTVEDARILEELKNIPADLAVGDSSKAIDASTESWRVWSFPFKRSRNMKTTQVARNSTSGSDAENTLETSTGMDGEKDVLTPKVKKKNVRAITPTPEQLASLNLKEGKNIVTFTFSTSMLGPQQVDARIFLWKWDSRVVISDVDGTITKSDVLGQFMPLVGMDWSQAGVTHLFSAIKENGYQLLFLSARAISQAYHTRQFLFNLKQDGKALPDGPVVISPDGLFPSLFREVIRRAPHEFKIACLEDIKALFPSDRNPFYAGFGNRDTDEFSYLKVGIPKGKIFIINPKGQVAVHHRLDTKSYTSLHVLVHDMFPPMSSAEQEDFNSWNFWRLPPPAIDV